MPPLTPVPSGNDRSSTIRLAVVSFFGVVIRGAVFVQGLKGGAVNGPSKPPSFNSFFI